MSTRTRYALVVLSAVGLAASLFALYVHYRILTEPAGYTSICEINETVSCQQVFESQYGTFAGVPVAAGGAIWSALVLMLSAWGMRKPASDDALRAAGYVFLLSTVGLAAVFYLAYASFFVLHQVCLVCLTIDVSVIGIFLLSANAAGPLRALQNRLRERSREPARSRRAARGDLARGLCGSGARIPARAGDEHCADGACPRPFPSRRLRPSN